MNRIGGPVNGVSRQAAHHAQQHGAARGGHGMCTVEHAQRANSPGVQRHDTVKRAIPASGAGLIFEGGVAIIGHR